jgi:hypothetical protein
VVAVLGVPERQFFVHLVLVSAPVAGLREVASPLEVVDDLGCRALGDTHRLSDVPKSDGRVGGDHLEHVGVVGYEPEGMIAGSGT